MIYLLDSNVFMEAARLYYGFDLAPGFWEWLRKPDLSERIASVQAVREEIMNGEGDLVEWARQLPTEFWIADSSTSIECMRELVSWASASERIYNSAAVDGFLRSADLRLIAQAMASNAAVTTREVSEPQSKRSVKIPDACAAFDVECVTPFETYRRLGMRLS